MLFIYPMWDSETERLGKKKCTQLGYTLHCIAEGLGFIGLLVLFVATCLLLYAFISGSFYRSMFWWLLLPFGIGILGNILFWYSGHLAAKKEFRYDFNTGEASWTENGERRTYKWSRSDLYPSG